MKLGITGTRKGMTGIQIKGCLLLFNEIEPEWIIHGAAHGVDNQAHHMADDLKIRRHIWPSNLIGATSDCLTNRRDIWEDSKSPLERNHDIVDTCDILVAFPAERNEILRSGTWATVRYALKMLKPTVIIYPHSKRRYKLQCFRYAMPGVQKTFKSILDVKWSEKLS